MSSDNEVRHVHFTVVSESVPMEQITAALSIDPDLAEVKGSIPVGSMTRRPVRENAWRITEAGRANADVAKLLDSLHVRLEGIREGLITLRHRDCSMILSVVQVVTPEDPTGPSFAIDPSLMRLLAELDAPVDVNLYVDVEVDVE